MSVQRRSQPWIRSGILVGLVILLVASPSPAGDVTEIVRFTGPGSLDVNVPGFPAMLPVEAVAVFDLTNQSIWAFDLIGEFDGSPVAFVGSDFQDLEFGPGSQGETLVSFGAFFSASVTLGDGPPLNVETREPALFEVLIDADMATVTLSNAVDLFLVGQQDAVGAVTGGSAQLEEQCRNDDTTLCLINGRFEVHVEWTDFRDRSGPGRVVQTADRSGLLYFFAADNWEMLVKMVNGCPITNHYWVFAAATTNVEYTITVTDTQAELEKEYFNPLGNSAAAVTDTSAFATCP